MRTIDRILFEAGALAANVNSEVHRRTATRELSALDLDDIGQEAQGRAHIVLAVREAALGVVALSSLQARALAAEGLTALVRAARAEPGQRHHQPPQAHELPYWVLR